MQLNVKRFQKKFQLEASPRNFNLTPSNNSKINEEDSKNINSVIYKINNMDEDADSNRPLEVPHAAGLFATINKQVKFF